MNGILLIDKPAGMTSFGVVARVRRVLSEENRKEYEKRGETAPKRMKVGHAGTLDPFATGLLILLVGKDTRRAGEFLKLDKKYEATIRLGEVSTTGDTEGEIQEFKQSSGFKNRGEKIGRVEIEAVLEKFRGKILQKVPNFSAVKIRGQRAYNLARKGIKVEMPVREVEIFKLELVDFIWPEVKIRCHVSSGTYIRSLGEDIGAALGVGGYLTELRRTQIGKFKVEDATGVDELMKDGVAAGKLKNIKNLTDF